jgi:hypothetical protein
MAKGSEGKKKKKETWSQCSIFLAILKRKEIKTRRIH